MTPRPDVHLSPIEAANLLAGQAVAEAELFLAERRDMTGFEVIDSEMWRTLAAIDPPPAILQPVRMLIVATDAAARTDTTERRAKWRRVMAALTDLVRHESLALRAAQPDANAPCNKNEHLQQKDNGVAHDCGEEAP